MGSEKDKQKIIDLTVKIFNEFGFEMIDHGDTIEIKTEEREHSKHITGLANIMVLQTRLFENCLMLSLSMQPENEGIIIINRLRNQMLLKINEKTDRVIEEYINDEVKIKSGVENNDG